MPFTIRYLRDEEVDEKLDKELRELLLECFPHEERFKTRRYLHACPQNRWMAFDENGTLAAHLAAYEMPVGTTQGDMQIIGIAEVAVAPQFRGQGLVKTLIEYAHELGRQKGIPFSMLGGKTAVYASSGYKLAPNPIKIHDPATGTAVSEVRDYVQYRPLGDQAWPEGEIDYRGPSF